jgi:predicted protein tyrosine phosphatase
MSAKPSKASTITICGLSALETTAQDLGATHIVTLIRDHGPIPTPKGVLTANHLRVDINDITTPADGLVHPQEEHITEVLNFIRAWDHSSPMIVHCFAGISRSTASAFSGLCLLNPDVPETHIARRLRQASPTATPNRLIVSIADDILGRNGRMVDAIDAIGQGQPAAICVPFALNSRQHD